MTPPLDKLQEKIGEILFDYHIRGCEIAEPETNKICDKRRKQNIKEILSILHDYKKALLKEINGNLPKARALTKDPTTKTGHYVFRAIDWDHFINYLKSL